MRKFYFASAVVLISMASYSATGAAPSPIVPPATTRTVSGTQIVHYKKGPVPVNLSSTTIAALVPNGHGGYNVLPGTGTSSGTFSVPNVPKGFYLLQIGGSYVWTSNNLVDADSYADYRSDIVAANSSTSLTFDLTNLNSWQSGDILELVCPNNLSYEYYYSSVGDTTFTGTFPYNKYQIGYLSVAAEGDQYYVAQMITQDLGSYPFVALGRYLAPKKFTQAQGSDTPIDGALKTIAQSNTFEANFNGADLTAQAVAANPGAALLYTGAGLAVNPGSLAKGQTTDTPDLAFYSGSALITTNGDLGQVLYGNPYSSKWPVYLGFSWGAYTYVLAPGATNAAFLVTVVYGITPTLPTSTSPVEPLVGVVSSPTVNGVSFFDNQSGVGTTPTLAWSPPTVGTANNYFVSVNQLSNNGGNTSYTSVAVFYTQGTSLVIPAGMLSGGKAYFFEITAADIPGVNYAKTPFLSGPTTGLAQVLSGVIQP